MVRLPEERQQLAELTFHLDRWADWVLSEAYRSKDLGSGSGLLSAYYRLRPLIPRPIQIALRRVKARAAGTGPMGWPSDGTWVALSEAYLAARMIRTGSDRAQVAPLWPRHQSIACILTHDVEGLEGQARCRRLAELELNLGFRSCFNFVAERYAVDLSLIRELQEMGHEIGLHGIKHDGKKFSSRRVFEERVEALRRYRDRWHVCGFRSPATHRRWEWMAELPFSYDSSYPDTDPYEPIPGGCGSPYPFVLGPLIELPLTLAQDHTLWVILQREALPIWKAKISWLMQVRGLITVLVHPDYLTTKTRWREYEELLRYLAEVPGLWRALPHEVATWWRRRGTESEVMRLEMNAGEWRLVRE